MRIGRVESGRNNATGIGPIFGLKLALKSEIELADIKTYVFRLDVARSSIDLI